MKIEDYTKNNRLKVIVKVNCNENKIIGFDERESALKVCVSAPPENNKANKELLKFLSKQTKKKARIIYGMKSKEKIVEFY